MGVQAAICCPCGNEKILTGLCATCYTLKWQDAEYFGGLREQVLSAMDTPAGCAVISIQECIIVSQASLCYI